jgi:prepilin-type N-terminal cleavage/methylation domain-containing protein
MNRKTGFTLIELLIVMTIMGVLMTLVVVSLRSSQATARDEKRKTDNSVIAQNLENYYKSGSASASIFTTPSARLATVAIHTGSTTTNLASYSGGPQYESGQYPPTDYMSSETAVRRTLRDIDPKVLRAPNVADSSSISLIVATDANAPTPNESTYVYQPLKGDGTLCISDGTDCRKFNLFYKLESSSVIQKITSKNQ